MKIALLGYGKMGKTIEQIALTRGHHIVLKKTEHNGFEGLETADVAIDFSVPGSAIDNISACLNRHIPIVSGTTGWLNHYTEMATLCQEKKGSFIYSSNFSLGVNLFFILNEKLAQIMKNFPEYQASIEEIHHTQKLDAPSGTALSLALQIINNSHYMSWQLGETQDTVLGIDALRIENIPGTHSVTYNNPIDQIQIKHTAHSREGFALGAIMAAEWIIGKKGVFSMRDVLGL